MTATPLSSCGPPLCRLDIVVVVVVGFVCRCYCGELSGIISCRFAGSLMVGAPSNQKGSRFLSDARLLVRYWKRLDGFVLMLRKLLGMFSGFFLGFVSILLFVEVFLILVQFHSEEFSKCYFINVNEVEVEHDIIRNLYYFRQLFLERNSTFSIS